MRMIRTTVQDQLGGTVAFTWHTAGLRCGILLPLARSLARNATMPTADAAASTTEAKWQPY
jgi:hypothetical protein